MKRISPGGLRRATTLLAVALGAALAWEVTSHRNDLSVTGQVVGARSVPAGRGSDSREFRILYEVEGSEYVLVTRRGVFDRLGRFGALDVGDPVALAVGLRDPQRAILDSFNARYPITLSLTAFSLVFATTLSVLALRGALPFRG